MPKYNFTLQHLYGEDHKYITKIIDILQANKQEESFIRKFYSTIPMVNLSDEECKIYASLARNAYEFFLNRAKNQAKIRIYDTQELEQDSDHTIIEIISDEMPFVFDSAMCLLTKHHINVERVAHPNIDVMRDADGNLSAIVESGSQELVIQIRTLHVISQELKNKIEQELKHVLKLVDLAVNDWSNILAILQPYLDKDLATEELEFLKQLKQKYFVFLGCASFEIQEDKVINQPNLLGIFREEISNLRPLIDRCILNAEFFDKKSEALLIGKLSYTSVIHREANIDYVAIKKFDENKNLVAVDVFIGLFTSILYYQSATLIPIIRAKLNNILNAAKFAPTSYAGKELISIVEALPRDELFQISEEELYKLIMEIYSLLFAPELRFFVKKYADTLNCLLFLPLTAANTKNVHKIKSALAFEFGNIINHSFSQINSSKLCYYHFVIESKLDKIPNELISNLEQELRSLIRPWEDNLKKIIMQEFGKNKGREVFNQFHQAFPLSYQEENYYRRTIVLDIQNTLQTLETKKIIFKLVDQVEGKNNTAYLKIYSFEELNLSSIMPMIQNLGFNVLAEQIYIIKPNDNNNEIWLHQFVLNLNNLEETMLKESIANIEEALNEIWQGRCLDDSYNQLILRANLDYRQVTLLRALAAYLYQIKIGFSKEYLGSVLTKQFELAKLLVSLFYFKFKHKCLSEERSLNIARISAEIEDKLAQVQDNIEDKIIHKFLDLINNILRTNYFLKNADGDYKNAISFKINSVEIADLPLPRPYREIFVYSPNFEAIHLRGGKVARGGLRWSDRQEDYRSEILGLMKTQIVKNSVIVPTGAKGGFIVKNSENLDRDSLQTKAINCYKEFLASLLDITDNIVDGNLQHPKNIVRYDKADPYLVVAADKGTASFSDIANSIAKQYDFWLGDAFASGGSKGYDHKKMGITAKGAWISVMRHFYEMGIDINKQEFTVIGIGDMSGDVFGNGMLLSNKIKLIAAFNHMHIFIDPKPDAHISFQERQRLFNLPRSTWMDYDAKLLSQGAKIYERKTKILELTPEIKQLFKIQVDSITPDALIKTILTCEADLLWNGGIGTYAKASFETNEQVGDKTNDNLRVNGADLRCKIIGEGGNLGFTQHGRVEYARSGGRINTDAIDNSAGVDCSDHEVNIKIILHKAIEEKQISEDERIKLLEDMTEDVAELVLKDNRTQTRALTIAENQGYDILASQEHFVDLLEEEGILDRKLECLPTKQQFLNLHANRQALTRPELSILLAYSKNSIYNHLIETSLADEEYFLKDLLLYFPESMREKFAKAINQHPLRREIITTSITNSMVNRVDTFYLHLTSESAGHKFSDIASAYTITRDLFGLRELWKEINGLDGKIPIKEHVKLYIFIKKFVTRSSNWLLRNYKNKINIAAIIDEYKPKIDELHNIIANIATGQYKDNFLSEYNNFLSMGVPEILANKIAILNLLSSGYNIADISNRYKVPVEQVAKIYFELGQRFSLDWLRYITNQIISENNWQKLAIVSFKDELYDLHRKITAAAIDNSLRHEGLLDKWYKNNDKHIKLYDRFIAEIKKQSKIEYAMIDISLKKLSVLLNQNLK
jgi:glutamate dehydrogenase